MGWFDAVATRYGCRVQGTTEAVLTVLEVDVYKRQDMGNVEDAYNEVFRRLGIEDRK